MRAFFIVFSCALFFSTAAAAQAQQNVQVDARAVSSAAEKGSPTSQYQLGLMLLSGQGVKKDNKKAAYWLQRAADQGSAGAAFVLAKLMYNDANIKGGKTGAYFYALIAATADPKNEERVALSNEIAAALPPELASVIEKKAISWKPKLEQLQFTMPPPRRVGEQ